MSTLATIFGGLLFVIVLLSGLVAILFGLPGTFIILAGTVIYAWLTGWTIITATTVVVVLLMTIVAEGLEFMFGVYGAQQYGASRLAMVGAVVGGIVGAIVGASVLFGLGAIPGAFLGAFAGAYVVEYYRERGLEQAMQSGKGAFWGRVAGTVVKGSLGVGMVILNVIALFVERF